MPELQRRRFSHYSRSVCGFNEHSTVPVWSSQCKPIFGSFAAIYFIRQKNVRRLLQNPASTVEWILFERIQFESIRTPVCLHRISDTPLEAKRTGALLCESPNCSQILLCRKPPPSSFPFPTTQASSRKPGIAPRKSYSVQLAALLELSLAAWAPLAKKREILERFLSKALCKPLSPCRWSLAVNALEVSRLIQWLALFLQRFLRFSIQNKNSLPKRHICSPLWKQAFFSFFLFLLAVSANFSHSLSLSIWKHVQLLFNEFSCVCLFAALNCKSPFPDWFFQPTLISFVISTNYVSGFQRIARLALSFPGHATGSSLF